MAANLSPEQRKLGIKRLTSAMRIFIGWGVIGLSLIGISIARAVGKPAAKGFFSDQSIALFSIGFASVMMAAIAYRAFHLKRQSLRREMS